MAFDAGNNPVGPPPTEAQKAQFASAMDLQRVIPTATEGEMEAGTETELRAMSPELVAKAIAELSPPPVPPVFIDVVMDQNRSVEPANGDVIRALLEGNHTLTLDDPDDDSRPHSITLRIAQDATGDRTLTLAGNVHTAGGLQINIVGAASSVTIYKFEWTGAAWSESGFDIKAIV